jgi:uncharacterized protein (TIGR00661 family)
MKLLYAIQGTGNGHVSRARDVVPALEQYGQVDVLISGTQSEVKLPFELKYRFKGASFIYNKKGGIDYFRSARLNLTPRLLGEIHSLPVSSYDLVINDFEPVSAWACRLKGVPCVAMGHQAAFLSERTPRPLQRDPLGEWILQHYAPAPHAVGFHFDRYDSFIYPPVIRADVRSQTPSDGGYYTVYLPAFNEQVLIGLLKQLPETQWQVFSRYAKSDFRDRNVWVRRVDAAAFTESLVHCTGILSGAGFETPAEALYLGKKIFTVPIRGQYEQYCNGESLRQLGVPVVRSLDQNPGLLRTWVETGKPVRVDYPDELHAAIQHAFRLAGKGAVREAV